MAIREINMIAIKTSICRLYGVLPSELLFDSDINGIEFDDVKDAAEGSADVSSDDDYFDFFTCRNIVEKCCFGKEKVCFILVDANDTIYGHYHPGEIKSKENYVNGLTIFLISKGIEIHEKKYYPSAFFMTTSFPEDSLYTVGDESEPIFSVLPSPFRVVWNENQIQLRSYNRTLLKSSPLKRLLVYKCSSYRIHTPSTFSFEI